jgi:hypothetical protein
MSQQERASWASLVVNAFIGILYFCVVFGMPGDSHLLGPGMAIFIVPLIIAAVIALVSSELVLRWIQRRAGDDPARREKLDERDRLINLRAGRNAYVVLVVAIGTVLTLIAMTGWSQSWGWPVSQAPDTVALRMVRGPLTGPVIAQLLLLALTLAALCRYLTRIVSYRRGY